VIGLISTKGAALSLVLTDRSS